MKKLNSFIGLFIVITLFITVLSLFYYLRFEKITSLWLFYSICNELIFTMPVSASLSILWPLVFRDRSEVNNPVSRSAVPFNATVFMFIIMALAFLFQEFGIPKIYNWISFHETLKSKGITNPVAVKDTTGEKFSLSEFNQVNYMPVKYNIAFTSGNSFIYFDKMYDGSGAYYVEGFRFFGFTGNKQLDYIITADYAKIVDDILYAVNPMFHQYSKGTPASSKRINGVKNIIMIYQPAGIYALSSESSSGPVSLIDVFLYNDYVFNSGINFFHIGNIIFNKIAYYIILIFMMVLSSTFGSAFKNQRLLHREYIQTASFYIISFFIITLCYDTLAAAVNMIYSMVI